MFRFRVTVNEAMLQRWRSVPERAQRNMKRLLREKLQPELQTFVDDYMREGPSLVTPFEFNTDKSRRYWFHLVDIGAVETDGEHYIRTDQIEEGWRVLLSSRFRGDMVTVQNIQFSRANPSGGFRNAAMVYNPYIIGHIASGWPLQANLLKVAMQNKFLVGVERLWKQSVGEAIKGNG